MLYQSYEAGAGPFEDEGWRWDAQSFALMLRDDAVITMRRSLVALADHQRYVHESLVIPGYGGREDDLHFRAVKGLTVLDIDHPSPTRWGATWQLARPLAKGERCDTETQVRIPRANAMMPLLMLAPIRPVRRIDVRVDFGVPSAADTAWSVEGAVGADPTGPVRRRLTAADLRENPVLEESFVNPRVGLVYGIGWTWAG